MGHRVQPLVAGSIMLAVAACTSPGALKTGLAGNPAQTQQTMAPTFQGSLITGNVLAPAGVIAAGGGNVIAAGGANVVAAGGANVIAPGGANYRTLQATDGIAQNSLAHAEVFLADGAGNPIPKLAHVSTDAKGNYTISGVPSGYTVMVMARIKTKDGKDAYMRTLVKTSDLGATANIDTGTTVLAASILTGQSSIGDVNLATFGAAAGKVDANLNAQTLPDLSDLSAMSAKIEALSASVSALKSEVDELKQDIASIKNDLSGLSKQLEQQAASTPAPASTGQPPTATTTANPTQGPNVTPTAATATPAGQYTTAPTTGSTPSMYPTTSATTGPTGTMTASPYASATPVASATTNPNSGTVTASPTATPTAPASPTMAAVTISGHLIPNPNTPTMSVTGIQVKLRNYNLTAYGSWDAIVTTDANGAWTATVQHETSQTDDFVTEINYGTEEGIGDIYVTGSGTYSYTRYGTGNYPTRLVTLP